MQCLKEIPLPLKDTAHGGVKLVPTAKDVFFLGLGVENNSSLGAFTENRTFNWRQKLSYLDLRITMYTKSSCLLTYTKVAKIHQTIPPTLWLRQNQPGTFTTKEKKNEFWIR
jgi:hypothetical protein